MKNFRKNNYAKTFELAQGLTISKIVTGLWQIADMEREGNILDPKITSQHMAPYVDAELTTFDMADHYGSSEIITGTFKNEHPLGPKVQLFTKWVPKPGKLNKEIVREAIERALDRMQQTQIDLMQFHAWHYPDPSWLDGLFFLKELKQKGSSNISELPISMRRTYELPWRVEYQLSATKCVIR